MITVYVSPRHIHRGKTKDRMRCPIALALGEQGYWAQVGDKDVRLKLEPGDPCTLVYHLPPQAQAWLSEYDSGAEPDPIAFVMRQDHE